MICKNINNNLKAICKKFKKNKIINIYDNNNNIILKIIKNNKLKNTYNITDSNDNIILKIKCTKYNKNGPNIMEIEMRLLDDIFFMYTIEPIIKEKEYYLDLSFEKGLCSKKNFILNNKCIKDISKVNGFLKLIYIIFYYI